jgi:hypothetical protein
MSLNLIEGERTRLAFVIEPNKSDANFYPMAFGYLNGKLSKAVLYSKSMSFEDNDGDPATLTMDSTDARLKIYGIRIYYQALSDNEILNNYIASFDDLNLRQKLYDSNNVYSADNTIDYLKVTSEAYQDDLQIPYMLLTGGYANVELDKWKRQSADNKEARLPVGKKDYRAVDVKVIYPKTDLFAGLEDYEFKNIYKDNTPMAEAYNQKPINGGAIMYAQGTSSMEYPIKNLRLRFKKDDDWYRVKTDIDPVEIICMKADYMESSGSHNTGAGNLIDRLYKDIQI